MDAHIPLPPNERCARCGGPFRCGVNDAGPCACTTLHLSAVVLERLRLRYRGCLCLACLAGVKDEFRADADADADADSDTEA